MTATLLRVNGNFKTCYDLCLYTIGKKSSKEPSEDWINKILSSRHSPIRDITFSIELNEVEFFVQNHLVRHSVGVEKYVQTSRSDRTNIDRSERRQTDPVNMIITFNIDSFFNVCGARLCHQASKETQQAVKAMINCIKDDPVLKYIVPFCMPKCLQQGGNCGEFSSCGIGEAYNNFLKKKGLDNSIENCKIFYSTIDNFQEK